MSTLVVKGCKNNWLSSGFNSFISMHVRKEKRIHFISNNNSSINAMKCIIFSLMLILMISVSSFVIVDASESSNKADYHKYYTSITIEADDTLWDIAQQYNTGSESTTQYVNSLKKLNNMTSDTLYNGNNLLIYYYTVEE